MLSPFHIAFPVSDIQVARDFYGGILGCAEGRSAETWVDFNLYGHQIVAHYQPPSTTKALGQQAAPLRRNAVDGKAVPVPHFGVVLTMEGWYALCDRLKAAGVQFEIEPYVRFKGEVGEQATMFFFDPFGNALEFKAFRDMSSLFAKQDH